MCEFGCAKSDYVTYINSSPEQTVDNNWPEGHTVPIDTCFHLTL